MRHILCVDLEATCWPRGVPPHGEESEIIEIGYFVMDLMNGSTIEKGGIYVRPTQSRVSQYCIDLTGITQQLLDEKGVTLTEACHYLSKFRELPWASFGEYDATSMQTHCLKRGIVYPFSFEHYNVKDMVNGGFKELIRLHAASTKTFGLKDALHLFGLAFVGRHHSGGDDAMNLGRLVWHLSKMMDREILSKIATDGAKSGVKP